MTSEPEAYAVEKPILLNEEVKGEEIQPLVRCMLEHLTQVNKEVPITLSLLVHLDISTNMDTGTRRENNTVLCMLDVINGFLRRATSPTQTIAARFAHYGAPIDDFIVYERRPIPPPEPLTTRRMLGLEPTE
jgi:hypothetical protein